MLLLHTILLSANSLKYKKCSNPAFVIKKTDKYPTSPPKRKDGM